MKKSYLMCGAAALCMAFASCSHDVDVDANALQKQKAYEYQAEFVKQYGSVTKNQDNWGFGSASQARTRGHNANANEWAATYDVPDPLTDAQKDIVRQYFQQKPNPTYDDPQWTNYFVQQVYKGGTKTTGSLSTEQYRSANNGWVVGSDHMDHLAAVDEDGNQDHINNFNFGTCSTNLDVLDKGQPINGGTTHSDEIMLMVNSTTNSFGYFNSDGSLGHTDKTGLVSYKTIMEWAATKGIDASCLEDGWNRSFMGFDFEQVIGEDIYARNDDEKKTVRYATIGDFPAFDYVWDGTETKKTNASDLLMYNGKPVPLLVAQTNQYCGINGDIDQNVYRINKPVRLESGHTQDWGCLDLTQAYAKLADGYLPVVDGTMCKWVKVQGGADGYYSDWIVTLTEAKTSGGEEPDEVKEQGRIFCEDMGSIGDFDFNDVVFDAYIYESGKVKINVLAAGGTLKLTVAGVDVHELLGSTAMLNTGLYSKPAQTIELTAEEAATLGITDLNSIPVIVEQTDAAGETREILLEAVKNQAPQKICVPVGTAWADEYVNINKAYTDFKAWVNGTKSRAEVFASPVSRFVDQNLQNNVDGE